MSGGTDVVGIGHTTAYWVRAQPHLVRRASAWCSAPSPSARFAKTRSPPSSRQRTWACSIKTLHQPILVPTVH